MEKAKRGTYEYNKKYAQDYMKKNCISVSFRLNKVTESDLIETYRKIPNNQKAEVFKQAIRDYGEKMKK